MENSGDACHPDRRRLHRPAVHRKPAGRGPQRRRHLWRDHARRGAGDELLRNHLRPHAASQVLRGSRSHLHAGRRTAVCRTPDGRDRLGPLEGRTV